LTEICPILPVLSAIAAGHEVYIVTDASGSGSVEGHEHAVQRMMQAGARPVAVAAYVSGPQRDWGRTKTADDVVSPPARILCPQNTSRIVRSRMLGLGRRRASVDGPRTREAAPAAVPGRAARTPSG
jgi:nicotinamidase-related amidase